MAQTRHLITNQGRARILGASNTPTNSGLKGIEINKIKISTRFDFNSYSTRDQFLGLRNHANIVANKLLGDTARTETINVTPSNFNVIQVTDDQVIFEVNLTGPIATANNYFNELGLYYNDNGDKLFLYAGLPRYEYLSSSSSSYTGQFAVTIGSSDSADITFTDPSIDFGKIISVDIDSLPKSNSISANNRNIQQITNSDFVDPYLTHKNQSTSGVWSIAGWHTQGFTNTVTATSVTSNTITLSIPPAILSDPPDYFPTDSYRVIVRVHSGNQQGKLYAGMLNVSNSVVTLGAGEGTAIGNGSEVQLLVRSPTQIEADFNSYQWIRTANDILYLDNEGRLLLGKSASSDSTTGIEFRPHGLVTNDFHGPSINLVGNEWSNAEPNARNEFRVDVGSDEFNAPGNATYPDEIVYIRSNREDTAIRIRHENVSASNNTASIIIGRQVSSNANAIEFRNLGTHATPIDTFAGAIRFGSSGNTVSIVNPSDKRRKKNIESLTNSIDIIKKIHPVKFNWKEESEDTEKSTGFIAQELQPIVPEAVSGSPDSKEMMAVDYDKLSPVAIGAIKELIERVEKLEGRDNILTTEISSLRTENAMLQTKVTMLKNELNKNKE